MGYAKESDMYPHIWILAFVITLACFSSTPSIAESGNRADGIRAFLQQGKYDLAISTAHAILSESELTDDERFGLLLVLAETEEKLAEMRQYSNVETAIRAYNDLHQEFSEKFSQTKWLWKIAWLNWKKRDFDRADIAAQKVLKNHPQALEAKKAALLHARYLIMGRQFPAARKTLLMHFGLNPNVSSSEELEGLVWLAVIDEAESRAKLAYETMHKIYDSHPEVIENNSIVFATYIHLLARFSDHEKTLLSINHFIKKYISTPESPEIRLLQADILSTQEQLQDAETVYGILSDHYGDSSIGKKASMRLLMLKLRGNQDKAILNQAIATLSNLASRHQLSEIETEAQLYQAELSTRLGQSEATYLDRALAFYALAASSEHPGLSATAYTSGSILLSKQLHALLDKQQSLKAVVLWKRYPQLRPKKEHKLSFGIAQAYIHLMDFSYAEEMLDTLYQQSKNTVWGQRVMLEIAHLWVEREDTDSVKKIMHWLANQDHTLYRQDMLLIVTTAQNKQGEASAASQTLTSIVPEDLTPELRHTYWRERAKTNMALKRWHTAADAWLRVAELSQDSEKWHSIYEQANAMILNKDYMKAEEVLLQTPGSERDSAWHFSLALCAQNTGRLKKAEEHLIPLSIADPADNYTIRARLLLAEMRSKQVIMEQQ